MGERYPAIACDPCHRPNSMALERQHPWRAVPHWGLEGETGRIFALKPESYHSNAQHRYIDIKDVPREYISPLWQVVVKAELGNIRSEIQIRLLE
jgi:hypothetical protein